jgi:hypothetical protein
VPLSLQQLLFVLHVIVSVCVVHVDTSTPIIRHPLDANRWCIIHIQQTTSEGDVFVFPIIFHYLTCQFAWTTEVVMSLLISSCITL